MNTNQLIICIITTVIVILLFLITLCKNYLYFVPFKIEQYDPHTITLVQKAGGKEVQIGELHGFHFTRLPSDNKHKSERKVVLYSHGNAGNIENRTHLAKKFTDCDVDLLLFDYSGFGKSPGSPSETQIYNDAQLCYDWLRDQGYHKDNIILYGESIGCPVSAKIASQNKVNKIILQSGLSSIVSFLYSHLPRIIAYPLSLFVSNDFRTDNHLSKFQGSCLIMHGRNDTLIDPSHAKELKESFNGKDSELIYVPGGHNYLSLDWKSIKKFIHQ